MTQRRESSNKEEKDVVKKEDTVNSNCMCCCSAGVGIIGIAIWGLYCLVVWMISLFS